MVKLIWTELSTEDLKEIFEYIAKDSARYASITVNKIYNRAQDIIDNPHAWLIIPEININAIREVIFHSLLNDHAGNRGNWFSIH